MKATIKELVECGSCRATGIYKGMGERDSIGVQCRTCGGTGWVTLSFTRFTGRRTRDDVRRVLECNPGIVYGDTQQGGMPYDDWLEGKPFPKGSEMREYTCPAWWGQCSPSAVKPEWDECIGIGMFSGCSHFSDKAQCWIRYDKERDA